MKNTLLNTLLLLALTISGAASAELYRGVDADGNVVYSDRPFDNAEQFKPSPISVMDSPKSGSEKKVVEEEKTAEFKYTDFDIVSPANKQTIRGESDLAVSLLLKPGLNAEQGHSIWLLVDGKAVIKNSQNMSFNIGQLVRGAHQLQGQVRDEEGKVVVRTRASIIYIHQASVSVGR